MVSGIRLRVALAAAAMISASSLALADSSGPKALNDSQMDLVTAGANATANGVARASGPLASTATVANTTASTDGKSAAAGGVGAGLAIAPQGTTAADSSVTVRADGPALTTRLSNTINTPNASADYKIAVVIASPLLAQ
jgi:hypothetical protein